MAAVLEIRVKPLGGNGFKPTDDAFNACPPRGVPRQAGVPPASISRSSNSQMAAFCQCRPGRSEA